MHSADVWSDWLLHRRHADDPDYGRLVQTVVQGFADRVLDGAQVAAGMTLVDVGAGEGLVALRAIDRIGASLRVILTDVSAPMLRYAETVAERGNVRTQCTFLECSAENLSGIADASADVVATRAALAYVADKQSALGEFWRVLKPGGRISIAEPVLQDEAFYARALRRRIDDKTSQSADSFLVLLHRWKAAQFPDTEEGCAKSPIANFSERDLLNMVRSAGFSEIHLQLHIDVMPSLVTSWDVFLGTSPHPWAPTLRQIFAEQFTTEERTLRANGAADRRIGQKHHDRTHGVSASSKAAPLSRSRSSLFLLLLLAGGVAHAGFDHELALDQNGIWGRTYQTGVQNGVIALELAGSLWFGNDNELGHTFWQTIDASVISGIGATALKYTFSRARPYQGNNPNLWFQGSGHQSFPSGEVTLQASFVTPFIANYGRQDPWVWALEILPVYDAFARLKSQAHWQTDVIAGWALGTAVGYWSSTRATPLSVQVLPRGLSVGFSKRF